MRRIARTKNASRNILFGVILKVYQIAIPFVMRTAIIYLLGVKYLGLGSLFKSILQVLNLAELGVGSAMVYAMYEPIARDDRKKICALMGLYRKYYRIIGLAVLAIGLALLPFIPRIIKDEVPADINIYVLYLLNLLATVASYLLFAYKNCLLHAHQREDVVSKIHLALNTGMYIAQFLGLYFLRSYYAYLALALICQLVTNVTTAIVVDKKFPGYRPTKDLEKSTVSEINRRIRDLFTAKLGHVVVGSADSIVISAFLGLTSLAIYQNYYFILNAVYTIVGVVFTSVKAGIGNSLVTDSLEKNYTDLKKLTFIINFIICVCCCCFIGMYQQFMRIWVKDESLILPYVFVILFAIYYYFLEIQMVWATFKDAAGLWHQDRFRPLIGAAVNLVSNIILVQYIGMYGIILSTILSYFLVTVPWMIHNLFKYLYKRSPLPYILSMLKYLAVGVLSCGICVLVTRRIHIAGIPGLIVLAVVSIGIAVGIQSAFYLKSQEWSQMIALMKKMLSGKRFGKG